MRRSWFSVVLVVLAAVVWWASVGGGAGWSVDVVGERKDAGGAALLVVRAAEDRAAADGDGVVTPDLARAEPLAVEARLDAAAADPVVPVTFRAVDGRGRELDDVTLRWTHDGDAWHEADVTRDATWGSRAAIPRPADEGALTTVEIVARERASWRIMSGVDGIEHLALGEVELAPSTFVSARVVDVDGRAVAGARVVLRRRGGGGLFGILSLDEREDRVVTSDRDGRVAIDTLPPASWMLTVEHDDHLRHRRDADVVVPEPGGGVVDLGDIVLDRGRVLGGRVVDERGLPVVDAYVHAVTASFDWREDALDVARGDARRVDAGRVIVARSGVDGRFVVDALPAHGARKLSVYARGRAITTHVMTPSDRDVLLTSPILDERLVRFVDASTGEPVVVDDVVSLAGGVADPFDPLRRAEHPAIAHARRVDASTWSVAAHRDEWGRRVIARAPGYREESHALADVIELTPVGTAVVTVVDERGRRYAGIDVVLTADELGKRRESLRATTGDDGRARFDGVRVGNHGLQCGGARGALAVEGGVSEATLVVERRERRIVVTLRDADGAFVAPTRRAEGARRRPEAPTLTFADAVPDEDGDLPRARIGRWVAPGRFAYERLAPGAYRLHREPGGEAIVDLPPDRDVEVEMTLRRWPRVRGLVLENGVQAVGAAVRCAPAGAERTASFSPFSEPLLPVTTRTGPDGRYELLAPAGATSVIASFAGGEHELVLDLENDEVYDVVHDRTAVVVRGVVVDERGEPIDGAQVGGAGQTRTDASGRFVLGSVSPGPCRVEVWHPDHVGPATCDVHAPSDDVRFVLPRGARVEVVVVDAAGEPIDLSECRSFVATVVGPDGAQRVLITETATLVVDGCAIGVHRIAIRAFSNHGPWSAELDVVVTSLEALRVETVMRGDP